MKINKLLSGPENQELTFVQFQNKGSSHRAGRWQAICSLNLQLYWALLDMGQFKMRKSPKKRLGSGVNRSNLPSDLR
ncbi:hypothetical protein EUGRSUZ_L02756 [Eucalyptus grandis]|uniref:Uncharacterized protein n=1 Tax=Eucalyptus grandis TaxID=71139 RepID=A0AAD9T8I7_EUCGR|nr:hypothetical protein EUGRSUZ_L02756 [Eucalyptus grandis]